ncbi:MATE family efflux transporter [Sulfitobacter donghicola]|uniref:Multidrug transporter n=1 Tax=Sulfitobacter donghicola DSW-25 = KCTC 12864 = JCM 14565 TaxID=1300350 RepID=A0A073IEW8_9RHOB|nr:MATE family efflux transporter [Sulfitobacter donghicola]KEJ88080.1 multidrug transporter [Sulfitobacter donghicola DSW-25 = KCTC 12864 = JCM 14565]KIN68701.1 DNA-damage-inducible protein F [Sulfitobacter donghicola DSW-25 = KCTC 12864 = JCM 14565]
MTNTTASELSHRRVLNIAVPVVLSNATVPILGAVDTGVVGQMGLAAPIGAVGIGAIILSAFYWVFGFLRMGTVGLTAQADGQGDHAEVAALLTRALMIGLGAGVVIILLQSALFWAAFQVSPASDEVETLARQYMTVRVWSAPAAIGLYGVTGWLIAQERTRAVLVLQLWMNGLNIALDIWFVIGLGWGVQGVAFATFLAEWSGLFLGLWFCRHVFANAAWRVWSQVFDAARWKRMMLLNTDILIRSLLLEAIFVSFMFMGAGQGDVTLAANQVLLQFLMIASYALDGFAFSAEALVGKAVGAKAPKLLRRAAVLTTGWGMASAVLIGFGFAILGGWIVDLMTTAPEVRTLARVYLPYLVFLPVIGCGAFMLDGVFVGATRSKDMRNMMLLSFGVYVICVSVLVPMLGNHGLWLSMLISFVARTATLGARYPALERSVGP